MRRGAFGTKETRRPLAEIVGVRVERSGASQSQARRIVLATSTRTSVPLTTHYSTGNQDATARVIREFLGLPEPPASAGVAISDLFRA